MKSIAQFKRTPGFTAYADVDNPLNKIVYSQLRECENRQPSSGISIKYVCEGEEHYELNGQLHTVKPG